jgi:protoporphyrinogen oxidase
LAVTAGVQKPFQDAVGSGVNSNLCSALAQLAREGEGVDLSIRWSLTKPGEGQPSLRLSREDAQSLTEAAESLSQLEPAPGTTLEGVITKLNEETAAFDGKVTFEAVVNGAQRRVVMEFAKDDDRTRDTLISAFHKRERIAVTGDLVRDGKRLRLEKPHDLQIEDQSDLD